LVSEFGGMNKGTPDLLGVRYNDWSGGHGLEGEEGAAMDDTNKYLNKVFEDIYKMEIDRSDKLDTQFNVHSALVTVFLGASVVLFEKSRSPGLNTFTVILYTSLVFFLVSISGAVYCLIRSYRGYKYSFLARPVEIQTYADEYERFIKFRRSSPGGAC